MTQQRLNHLNPTPLSSQMHCCPFILIFFLNHLPPLILTEITQQKLNHLNLTPINSPVDRCPTIPTSLSNQPSSLNEMIQHCFNYPSLITSHYFFYQINITPNNRTV